MQRETFTILQSSTSNDAYSRL